MKAFIERSQREECQVLSVEEAKTFLALAIEDRGDDHLILNMLSSAVSEFEHLAQIAVVPQTVTLTVFEPDMSSILRLPIGPVSDGNSLSIELDQAPFTAFDFVPGIRPLIHWHKASFLSRPGQLVVSYTAGFTRPNHVPSEIRQAILDQTALYYDARSLLNAKGLSTSPHMARIAARYRGVSI